MTSVAHRIKVESIAVADSCNGDVICRAIDRLRRFCPYCLYSQNKEQYEILLRAYAHQRVMQSQFLRDCRFSSHAHRIWMRSNISDYEICGQSAIKIKEEMLKIGPCEKCKRLYNGLIMTSCLLSGSGVKILNSKTICYYCLELCGQIVYDRLNSRQWKMLPGQGKDNKDCSFCWLFRVGVYG